MRHAILLTVASVLLASLTWMAWHADQARLQAARAAIAQQLSDDARTLEQQYLTQARTLIGLLDPADPLLTDIRAAQPALATMPELAERDPLFQDLVARIRAHLLQAPDPAQSEPLLQEWRRLTDQMNGALHRRQQLLQNASH